MRHYTTGKTHTHTRSSEILGHHYLQTRTLQHAKNNHQTVRGNAVKTHGNLLSLLQWISLCTLETQTSPNYELAASWLTLNENEPYEPTDCKEKRAMYIWIEIHELEIAHEERHRQVAPAKASVRLTHQRRGENIRRSARFFKGRNKIIFVTIFSASSSSTRWVSPV